MILFGCTPTNQPRPKTTKQKICKYETKNPLSDFIYKSIAKIAKLPSLQVFRIFQVFLLFQVGFGLSSTMSIIFPTMSEVRKSFTKDSLKEKAPKLLSAPRLAENKHTSPLLLLIAKAKLPFALCLTSSYKQTGENSQYLQFSPQGVQAGMLSKV